MYKPWRTNVFFQFEVSINVLISQLFSLHLNTYVMGLWLLYIFYSFSAGIDFRRQNLTSIDVRFWRSKVVSAQKGLHYVIFWLMRREFHSVLSMYEQDEFVWIQSNFTAFSFNKWKAGPDGSFVSTRTWNLGVPGSSPGRSEYLSSWLCIYSAPNCSKAWSVKCCLWHYKEHIRNKSRAGWSWSFYKLVPCRSEAEHASSRSRRFLSALNAYESAKNKYLFSSSRAMVKPTRDWRLAWPLNQCSRTKCTKSWNAHNKERTERPVSDDLIDL